MRRSLLSTALLLSLSAFFSASALADAAPDTKVHSDLSHSPSGTYALDPHHASLVWKINHLGYSHLVGRFDTMEGTLKLDAQAPEKSTLYILVNPASISTHVSALDAQLVKDPFFNAKKFPKITFVSRRITLTGPQTGTIEGDVTLLGVTKPIALQAKLVGAGMNPFAKAETVGFSATGSLKRSDFGLTAYAEAVGDVVDLQIDAEFDMKPAEDKE